MAGDQGRRGDPEGADFRLTTKNTKLTRSHINHEGRDVHEAPINHEEHDVHEVFNEDAGCKAAIR